MRFAKFFGSPPWFLHPLEVLMSFSYISCISYGLYPSYCLCMLVCVLLLVCVFVVVLLFIHCALTLNVRNHIYMILKLSLLWHIAEPSISSYSQVIKIIFPSVLSFSAKFGWLLFVVEARVCVCVCRLDDDLSTVIKSVTRLLCTLPTQTSYP